jgi:hypothetical protein
LEHVSENFLLTKENLLPNSLKVIGESAFKSLVDKEGNLKLTALPPNLESIGAQGLYNSGYGVTISHFPDSLTQINN